jgi:hypothetical protein
MNSFYFFEKEKMEKLLLALVGITLVKGTSVIDFGSEKGGCALKS